MKLSFKQKFILYVCIIFLSLLALYTNAFLKERKNLDVDTISNKVDIYVEK